MGAVAAKHGRLKRLILPVMGALLAALATGCQTTSNIAPHFVGEKYKRAPASEVQLRKIPTDNVDSHVKNMSKQGYFLVGKATFQGPQQGIPQIKGFAASVGADLVEGAAAQVGTAERTYMALSSYTSGRTITSVGASTGYASGSGSGNISTPFGPVAYNSQGSATAFGASTTSTYVPGQATYAPRTYNVPITQQAYMFWISPSRYLSNWMESMRLAEQDLPPAQRTSSEELKRRAAIFAQAWNLPLPSNLRPFEPIPQLSEDLLAQARAATANANASILRSPN